MNLYLKTKDHSVSGEAFELLHDPALELLITSPKPPSLDKYYQSENYISHTDANKSFTDRIYQTVKKYNLGKKLRLAKRYAGSSKKLLDVGAGTGDFLLTAKKKGWEVFGVEPNSQAAERATQKGIKLQPSLEALSKEQYQIITLWHVLEHMPNLETQIQKLKTLLAEDGTLIIAVPNFKSFDANYYKSFWAAYDVPRHLWHFSKTAIEKIFAKEGMQLIKTHPMIFDAFYVSLLSEKYKTGKEQFSKALYSGMRSNVSAWTTGEYSSLIYILKKR